MHTLNKPNLIKVDYLKMSVMFLPIIFYNPFVFVQLIYRPIRVGFFLLLCICLFFRSTRYSKNDVRIFVAMLFLSIVMLFTNSFGTHGLISIGNIVLTLFFGWSLSRYLKSSTRLAEVSIGIYVFFFFLIPIFSVLNILYLSLFGELAWFDFDFWHPMKVTLFGLALEKDFVFTKVFRSFFYFDEPVYLAIFYAANIILVGPYLKKKSTLFIIANLVGGFFTYSYTFYFILLGLYIYKRKNSPVLYFILLILLFCHYFVGFFEIESLFLRSSADDRLFRFKEFFLAMDAANTAQAFFGHGILASNTGFSKGFSSGLAISIYELGYIGTALQMIILFTLRPSFMIFILIILASLVENFLKMPLFWFLLIITSHLGKNRIWYFRS